MTQEEERRRHLEEMLDLEEWTEDDIAFLEELRDLMEEFQ